ncbi:MAG: hypothetical protein NTX87_19230, partial [Planctomycetota bacterium]|nr:hypothetical protein [Planctomycetota bacterium]
MTIAACYLSAEGVVLGADSTSTVFVAGRGGQSGCQHHYDYAQKVFEFGDPESTAGLALWGLGSMGVTSHRTLIAETADEATRLNLPSLEDVAALMSRIFWEHYQRAFQQFLARTRELHAKGDSVTAEEKEERTFLREHLSGGFCLGGRWGSQRQPKAFEICYDPLLTEPPKPAVLQLGTAYFWGCPNLIDRLLRGMDYPMFSRILESGKWQGTADDLFEVLEEGAL